MKNRMKTRYDVHFALPRHTDSNTHNLTKAISFYQILRNYDRTQEVLKRALESEMLDE